MSKLTLPSTIIKIKPTQVVEISRELLDGIWPIGTLYLHTPTNTYFRFLPMGRWNGYAISFKCGMFGRNPNRELCINCRDRKQHITDTDKNTLVNRVNDLLNQ